MDSSRHQLSDGQWLDALYTGRGSKTPAGRTMTRWPQVLLLAALGAGACSIDRDRAVVDSPQAAIASEDTVLSVDGALRKFREHLPQPSGLTNASTGREELARRFVTALAKRDTSTLASLHLTPAEFAWLYYPESPIAQPPYSLPPGIAWFELHGNSEAGLRRALEEYGGQLLAYRGLECPNEPVRYGRNTLWNKCAVRVRDASGAERQLRLFATIVERNGRFKVASAANDL